jgi:1-acyl-sn-glycerol-3-phosphate acyltransferase
MSPKPLVDFGAGLTTKVPSVDPHPGGEKQHGTPGQVERAFTAASTFFSGMLAISASQFLGAPLKAIDPKFYGAYMAFTKQSFGVLITTMTQWWSPTVVRVSGDSSIPKQLFRKKDGSLECRFPKRIVMMANHQLYTDWLYLWWVAYTNNMHGYIYIILKESLKNVPIIGWGAQFYNFIFLSRKWEQDKHQFQEHLDNLNNPADPMWLLIFPEGTNLAKGTRERSKAWAEKNGLQDMKHQLLPRSRGLQFTLQRLQKTTEWLYDCTIGYEGVPPGKFGQDIFTLRSSMFEGRPPKSVNMHFRRFKISTIPIDDDQAFEVWVRNRWREKDYLLEHFSRFNRFPNDIHWMTKQQKAGRTTLISQPAKWIETEIKSNSLEEFLSIFAPLTSVMMVLFIAYGGANPSELMEMLGNAGQKGKNALQLVRDDNSKDHPLSIQQAHNTDSANMASLSEIDKLTPAAAQKEIIQKYLNSVRPAASAQIALPDDALRKPAKMPLQKKPMSVKSQPAMKTKIGSTKKKATPSAASAPVAKGKEPLRRMAAAKEAPPVPAIPRDANLTRRLSLGRTIHPGSSVSKAAGTTETAITKAKPKQIVNKRPSAIQNASTSTTPNRKLQSTEKTNAKRQVTVDPGMLAKMKGPTPAPSTPKKVSIDPKTLAKMKPKTTQVQSSKAVKVDPSILRSMQAQRGKV